MKNSKSKIQKSITTKIIIIINLAHIPNLKFKSLAIQKLLIMQHS